MPQFQKQQIHPDMTLRQLAAVVDENFNRITQAAPNKTDGGWSTDNVTENKDLDVSTATLADVANTLATLINILTEQGVLKS